MSSKFLNRARQSVTTGGSGDIVLGGALASYQTMYQAGAVAGDMFPYCILDGAAWEIGVCTLTAVGLNGSISRTTITKTSNQNTTPLNVSTKANVSATYRAEDLAALTGLNALLTVNNLSDVANAASSRANLGLGSMATQAASSVAVTGGAISGVTISSSTINGSSSLNLLSANNLSDLPTPSTARTNLGLGSMATQAASAVAVTGGTITGVTLTGHASLDLLTSNNLSDVPTPATARTNLGLGSMATQNSTAVAITGGTLTGVTMPAVDLTGTLAAGQVPIFTGDMTTAGGTLATAVTKIGGKAVTLGGALTISGAFGTTLTATATTSITLPTSGVLVSYNRTTVSDANYSVAAGISFVAYTSITASRVVTLPAASTFTAGQQIIVVDESGSLSQSITLSIARAGSDTLNGSASSVVLNAPYAYLVLESNGSTAWTIVGRSGVTVSRSAIADANYTVLLTDREVTYTSITAARVVTLCSAATFPVGVDLLIHDESGSVSLTNTLTISRAGSDTIDGLTTATLVSGYGFLRLRSNGSNTWTVCGRSVNIQYFGSSGTYTPTPGMSVCDVYEFGGGGGGGGGALQVAGAAVSGGAGGGGGSQNPPVRLTAAQIGVSKAVTIGAGGTAGAAATVNSTAGGNGGVGGNTTLGTLAKASGGGGGAGGQLAATSGGGGGAGSSQVGASSTSATGAAGGVIGGGAGGTGVSGVAPTILQAGGGGTGGPAAGTVPPANNTVSQGGSGGGAGGGITTGNVASAGSAAGNFGPAGTVIAGASGGAVNTIGGTGVVSGLLLGHGNGSGGGGGGAGISGAAGAGGVGALGGGGGGGGGSMTNGGTAGTGGVGGAGQMWIVEFF